MSQKTITLLLMTIVRRKKKRKTTHQSIHAMSKRIAQVPNSLVARAKKILIAEESATVARIIRAKAKINALHL